jgi:hypothetical protein
VWILIPLALASTEELPLPSLVAGLSFAYPVGGTRTGAIAQPGGRRLVEWIAAEAKARAGADPVERQADRRNLSALARRQPERLAARLADAEAMDRNGAFGRGAQLAPQHAAGAGRVTFDNVFLFVLHPEEITRFDIALERDDSKFEHILHGRSSWRIQLTGQ